MPINKSLVNRLLGEFRALTSAFYRATACNATHGIAKAFLSVCLSVRTYVGQTRVL